MRTCLFGCFLLIAMIFAISPSVQAAEAGDYSVGVATVDITPAYPIRLCGYAVRKTESTGVEQHLFAKALAIGRDAQDVSLLITVDNTAVPGGVIEEVAKRLTAKAHVKRERLVVCSSHTHCAPCLTDGIVNIFGAPVPADQQATIDRYTREVTDKLEQVALAAIADRKPARLAWGVGDAPFAANRRTRGGPVEHAMPVLVATGTDGRVRAIVANYACHCTTLGGDFNKICGDWAGYAQQYIQQRHPDAVAMITIGCAGDANPAPRGTLFLAQQHGRELADAVDKVIGGGKLTSLDVPLTTAFKRFAIPYEPLPSKAEWEELAKRPDAIGGNARLQLAKLNRGEKLPTELPYVVETWTFGDQLAMVFLAGEVVVDYDLRLRNDFDPHRLWISAYSNDVPCYIPSKRVLAEGGYEGGGAMTYYGRPAKLAPETEDLIIGAVHTLLPSGFRTPESLKEFPPPLSPEKALSSFKLRDDLAIEQVVCEPLVTAPVAIDWGADGRLWVVEMNDYPNGLHENHLPGGRVKVLESTHHDGHYDKATVFLDGLRMPDGIMAWGKGVLICAAPDILYAEDTHGDGRADVVKVLCTGFDPNNEQWLVNGLAWGLDNWVYGASSIMNHPIHVNATGATIELGNRDFRMHPDTGEFEPAAGRTQYCRVRDDWGDWFGNDNSNLLWNYPLPEHYLRRNPAAVAPKANVLVPAGYDINQLYPASRIIERYNSPQSAGRTTSACGPAIYRDRLMGDEFYGNAFGCEPVHNMVYRLVLEPKGVTFRGHRSADEQHSEFLASTDNWFRPVQVRTGPDGALWVVDMYRFVIEHPRWIPPARLARLNLRAGADMGRIYRIYPKGKQPRPIPDLTKLSTADLSRAMENPSGTLRDTIQRMLVERQDRAAAPILQDLARSSTNATTRVQALCTLDGLHELSAELLRHALSDENPQVRRQAVRLSEPMLNRSSALAENVLKLAADPDVPVRYQVALSMGEWDDPRAAAALGELAIANLKDPWFRAAIASSAGKYPIDVLKILLANAPDSPARTEMALQLIATPASSADAGRLRTLVSLITPASNEPASPWHFAALARVLDVLDQRHEDLAALSAPDDAESRETASRCQRVIDAARTVAQDVAAPERTRLAAIPLLARGEHAADADLQSLGRLLDPQSPAPLQSAALRQLSRGHGPGVANVMLSHWKQASPALRSLMLGVLVTRPEWANALLDAIEERIVQPGEIPASTRARLLAIDHQSLHARAQSLLTAQRASTRQQVIDQYKPVLSLKGDATKGAAIFGRTCTTCHLLAGQGHAVGPDLSALTDRSTQALMIAILDPNAAVDGKFVNYIVELRDGRTLSGIIESESAANVSVLQPNGVRDTVSRADIKKMRSTGLSLMPEDLQAGMSVQDLADLIEFVRTAGPAK